MNYQKLKVELQSKQTKRNVMRNRIYAGAVLLAIVATASIGNIYRSHAEELPDNNASNSSPALSAALLPPNSISVNAEVTGSGLGANVLLTANAISGEGIDFVEFYDGTRLLGKDNKANNPPANTVFTLEVSNVGGGSHTYRAILVLAGGGVVVSSPDVVTVGGAVTPKIEIVTPASNRIFEAGDDIEIKAAATANGGVSIVKVEFCSGKPSSKPRDVTQACSGATPLGEDATPVNGFFAFTFSGAAITAEYQLFARVITTAAAPVSSSPTLVTVIPPVSAITVKKANSIQAPFGSGQVYYVDGDSQPDGVIGDDMNGNGTIGNPWQTLKKALAVAVDGSTIVFRAGTYRGADNRGTIGKRLTLQASPNETVWFKGSDVVTGWQQDNVAGSPTFGLWFKNFPHEFGHPTPQREVNVEYSQNPLAGAGDQVFIDGRPLTQVARFDDADFNFVPVDCGGGVVREGTFCLDYGATDNMSDNRLYIKDNPTGKTVEATTQTDALNLPFNGTAPNDASDSVIRNIGFAHYADKAINVNAMRVQIKDNTFVWNGNLGLGSQPIGGATLRNTTYNPSAPRNRLVISGNTFSYNARQGVGGAGMHNLVFENNLVTFNNLQRFRKAWGGAGAKFTWGDDQEFRDNVFADNLANGLWLDVSVTDAVIVNNIARRNQIGLFFEVSSRAIIASNLAEDNAAGIQISNSSKVSVYNNTLIGNNSNLPVIDWSRINNAGENGGNQTVVDAERDAGIDWETRDVVAKNNIFADAAGGQMTDVKEGSCGSGVDRVGPPCDDTETNFAALDYNLYYRSDPNKPQNLVSWYPRVDNDLKKFGTLATVGTVPGFRSTGNETNGKELTGTANSVFVNAAIGDYRLKANVVGGYQNPARAAGQGLSDDAVLDKTDGAESVADVLNVAPGTPVNMGALDDSILRPPTGANQRPVVNLVAPTANQSVVFGAPVTLSAAVTDPNGNNTIESVEFRQGATFIGNAIRQGSTNNYNLTWTPGAAGTYSITARATDESGATTTSTPEITLTVTKAVATIRLGNLAQTYNGTARTVTATTAPAGLAGVAVTYNGLTTVPVNAGSYAVVASLNNPNYTAANALGTLVIGKAASTTTVASSTARPTAGQAVTLTSTVSSVAGSLGVGTVQFKDGTANLGAPVSVTNSGAATLTTSALAAGAHSITAVYNGAANFGPSTSPAVTVTVQPVAPLQTPFPNASTPRSLPGKVEAENFDAGGEGIAYHDETPTNLGNSNYRANVASAAGVDVKTTADGGAGQKTIGYFQAGEWLEYTVNVTAAGNYKIAVRVSAAEAGRTLRISFNNEEKAVVTVPNTGSYNTYQTVTVPSVALSAGEQVMRVEATGTLDYFDLNWIEIQPAGSGVTGLFAAPDGGGTACTEAAPCTLEGARNKIRAENLNDNLTADLAVYLRGGTYTLTSTFELMAADSGSNGHYVVYKAYPNETPIISGGKQITGWTIFDNVKNIYRAPVSAGFETRQLYADGVRAIRARGGDQPSGFTVTEAGFQLPATGVYANMASWRNRQDVEFVDFADWKLFRCGVQSVSGRAVTMKNPCWDNAQRNDIAKYNMGLPEWIENAYELLDEPGEWYLDRAANFIYYKPRAGEDLLGTTANPSKVYASELEKLIGLTGTLAAPVHHLKFSNLTFNYGGWLNPNTNEGFASNQASFYKASNGKTLKTPGNISVETGKWIVFERNKFEHLGAVALDFFDGSQNNTITGNRFEDISGGAIELGGNSGQDHHPTDSRNIIKNNTISNNYITRVAVEYPAHVGILVTYAENTVIEHNELSYLPYSGISLGWGWGREDTPPSVAKRNKINNNYVHHVMQTMLDGAGIYVMSDQGAGNSADKTIVSGNHIRVLASFDGLRRGLQNDEGSAQVIYENNVVRDILGWLKINPEPNSLTYRSNYADALNLSVRCRPNETCALGIERNNYFNERNITYNAPTLFSNASIPPLAQSIINAAGIEPAYRDIKR